VATTSDVTGVEDVLRGQAPHVLVALLRRYGGSGGLGDCEDAVQEALHAAATTWTVRGVPERPRGWLIRVASRRLVDARRRDHARARREQEVAARQPADARWAPSAEEERGDPDEPAVAKDDTLTLLFLCCHPALTTPSQVALTLRAVAGLTTAQIAAAFLVPPATMAQRISRAKATLHAAGARFERPAAADVEARLVAVRHVLYLVFNEGYTASSGADLVDVSLTEEATRLTRELRKMRPDDRETAGLLALMLLTDARRRARTDERGDLVPLREQDRARWDRTTIAEGVRLLEDVLPRGEVGPYQLQAAIAAVHAEATAWNDTDWPQILVLYRMLARLAPGPAVTLNLAVAAGMAEGPHAGLAVVEPLLADPAMGDHHRTHAVRAHLLEMAGRLDEARDEYTAAARRTTSLPEQRYLNARRARLGATGGGSTPAPASGAS